MDAPGSNLTFRSSFTGTSPPQSPSNTPSSGRFWAQLEEVLDAPSRSSLDHLDRARMLGYCGRDLALCPSRFMLLLFRCRQTLGDGIASGSDGRRDALNRTSDGCGVFDVRRKRAGDSLSRADGAARRRFQEVTSLCQDHWLTGTGVLVNWTGVLASWEKSLDPQTQRVPLLRTARL